MFGIIIESPPTFLETVFYRYCLLMAFLLVPPSSVRPSFSTPLYLAHALFSFFSLLQKDIVKYFQLSGKWKREIKTNENFADYYYGSIFFFFLTTIIIPYPAVCKRIRKRFWWHNWTVQNLNPSGVGVLLWDVPWCRRWIPDRNPLADRSTYSSCRDFSAAHQVGFSANRSADRLKKKKKRSFCVRKSNIRGPETRWTLKSFRMTEHWTSFTFFADHTCKIKHD